MFKNKKGFSLIELMVVVAIIGILSAVAVPQFQKFQRKAKQSEIKANLAALYTAEKVFLAEHGTYYSNMLALGMKIEGNLIYNFGFPSGSPVLPIPDSFGATPPGGTFGYLAYRIISLVCGSAFGVSHTFDTTNSGHDCKMDTSVVSGFPASSITTSTFLATAHGNISGATLSELDTWSMSHRKELVNIQNGAL